VTVVLVDTSIWIDFLRSPPGVAARRLDEVISAQIPFAIAPVILQEILQGARSAREFKRLKLNLTTQRFLHPLEPVETYVAAADIYCRCRWAGITPRSATDCLIARIAIEHGASLLHNDADFDRIARVVRELTIY
jgi:hypothetical protein